MTDTTDRTLAIARQWNAHLPAADRTMPDVVPHPRIAQQQIVMLVEEVEAARRRARAAEERAHELELRARAAEGRAQRLHDGLTRLATANA